jgi:hypothetical protein
MLCLDMGIIVVLSIVFGSLDRTLGLTDTPLDYLYPEERIPYFFESS